MGFLYQNTTTNNVIIGCGDSLMAGNNSGTPLVNQVTLPNFQGMGWSRYNAATAGITPARQLRDADSINGIVERVLPNLSPSAPVNLVMVWCISNAFASGQTLTQGLDDLKALCLELKRWGCKVLVMGHIARFGVADSYVPGMHNELMNVSGTYYYGGFADAFWNPAYMAPFGQNTTGTYPSGAGANNGTYYDTDKTHLKAAGFSQLVSGGSGYDLNSIIAALINNTGGSLPQPFVASGLTATKYALLNQKDVFDIMTAGL